MYHFFIFWGSRAYFQLAFGGGAEVKTSSGAITLINNTFTNNSADDGGGLFISAFNDNATINIYNNIAFNNTAQEMEMTYLLKITSEVTI